MEFHETQMGHFFFGQQLPQLIKALQSLAEKPAGITAPVSIQSNPDILRDLFKGYYQPGEDAAFIETPRYKKLKKEMEPLQKELREKTDPDTSKLVDRYGRKLIEILGEETEVAFEAGFRCATQLIFAGLAVPEKGEGKAE